jgi:hypothetical protein
MPQIIVTADRGQDPNETPVVLREWVHRSDFDSELFGRHLVERLGWAIEDACDVEEHSPAPATARAGA